MTAGWALLSAVALFLGILLCLDVGFRWGRRRVSRDSENAHEGIGAIEAAVFALLGLLLGFSFAGATSRLDTRRQLIVEEANAIGTAYLRLDLLPAAEQPVLRRLFREYLESRLRVYDKIGDQEAIDRELTLGAQIQMQIWQAGLIAASHETSREAVRLLVPALNEMIDVTTARAVALHTYLPPLILLLLLSVALMSGLLAGDAMARRKNRSGMHMILYAAVVALTVYAILDLDQPRSGLIRLTAADHALEQLKESIR
jgi:hypothetical protein